VQLDLPIQGQCNSSSALDNALRHPAKARSINLVSSSRIFVFVTTANNSILQSRNYEQEAVNDIWLH